MVGVPPADGNNRVLGHSLVPRLPFGLTIDRPLLGCVTIIQWPVLLVKGNPDTATVLWGIRRSGSTGVSAPAPVRVTPPARLTRTGRFGLMTDVPLLVE